MTFYGTFPNCTLYLIIKEIGHELERGHVVCMGGIGVRKRERENNVIILILKPKTKH